MQFRTDETDVALDVPDGLSAAAGPSEKLDVAGVGHGVVGTDQAEERAFPAAVCSGQGPVLALADGPVEMIEDDALAIPDRNAAHPDDGGRQDLVQIRLPLGFFAESPVFNRDDVRDEGGNLRDARDYEDKGCRGG